MQPQSNATLNGSKNGLGGWEKKELLAEQLAYIWRQNLTAKIAHGIAQRAITPANLCIQGPCQNLFYHNKNHFDSSPLTNRTSNQSGVKFIDKKYIKRIYT